MNHRALAMCRAVAFVAVGWSAACRSAPAQPLDHLFRSGDDGYKCFRIPAIVSTNTGTLLAFAEGRKNGCSDAGDIDLVVKRSDDVGRTWSPLAVVWDDGANTCGNPAPVVDRRNGKVVLLSTWNRGTDREPQIIDGTSRDTRRIFVLASSDNGKTWSGAREITTDVKKPDWTWYATGPVNGIQIRSGTHRGRLVVPCDHIEAGTKKYFSHTIHSDDGGVTWTLGGSTPTDQVNESTVAEVGDGTLMLNMRNYTSARVRQVSLSRDGGASWTAPQADATLIEPVCQASLLWSEHEGRPPLLAFSNPASQTSRTNLTVRISDNDGRSWARQLVVHQGPSAYSSLVTLRTGNLAILFEAGTKSPYEGIAFRELPIQRFERARPPAPGETPYEQHLEIRTSRIPHAGNGVFTTAPIPQGAYLGAYAGEFITEDEFLRRSAANRWQYMMGLLDCARPHSNGLVTIDGIDGNVFTRMNYAPPEFQNVRFEKICEAPFVKIVALRDIAAGEELWVDYGPRYRYDFMDDPAVIAFFANLRAQRAKKDGAGRLPSPLR